MGGRRVVKVKKKSFGWGILFCVVIILMVAGGIFMSQKRLELQENIVQNTIEIITNNTVENEKEYKGYSISSSCTEASEAGARILESGGNAVDAAVAIAYALGVVEPYGSGIGGGGCMVIYDPETEGYYFYNYASEAAQSNFSTQILVPGFVSGMEAVRKDFGTMELETLLKPAMEYCDGFAINEEFELRIDRASGYLGTNSVFYQDGHWLVEGEVLVQPELKETLALLVQEGADSFYTGTIAEKIVAQTCMTMQDLAAYETLKQEPVISTYREYDIVAAAAPYSGVTLIQMLNLSEMLGIEAPQKNAGDYLSKLEKATVTSHADRVKNLSDPRFADNNVVIDQIVSESYLESLLQLEVSGMEIEEESEDTTGFTVIDENGMVVACTNTLSYFFGSRVNVGGFYLNNSGSNFGSGINAYESGKRPRTHISPAILKSDSETIAIASPGGNAIVKVLASVIMDVCKFDTEAQAVVDKQRVLFKESGVIYCEKGYETELQVEVSGSGYRIIPIGSHSEFGNVALSGYEEGFGYYAVTDVRRNGDYKVANYN